MALTRVAEQIKHKQNDFHVLMMMPTVRNSKVRLATWGILPKESEPKVCGAWLIILREDDPSPTYLQTPVSRNTSPRWQMAEPVLALTTCPSSCVVLAFLHFYNLQEKCMQYTSIAKMIAEPVSSRASPPPSFLPFSARI